MKNEHIWRERDEDGEKYEIRATKFAREWTFAKREPEIIGWTTIENPNSDLLEKLHDHLHRKYQRRRAAYEDVVFVERWLARVRRDENQQPEP